MTTIGCFTQRVVIIVHGMYGYLMGPRRRHLSWTIKHHHGSTSFRVALLAAARGALRAGRRYKEMERASTVYYAKRDWKPPSPTLL